LIKNKKKIVKEFWGLDDPLLPMKITIVKSNIEAKISGTPAIVTCNITQRDLNQFNRQIAEVPSDVRGCLEYIFGKAPRHVTMKDLKKAVE